MTLKPSIEDGPELKWAKSSHSTNDGPACVEVAAIPGNVLIRDSKNPQGPRLSFEPDAWASFLSYTTER